MTQCFSERVDEYCRRLYGHSDWAYANTLDEEDKDRSGIMELVDCSEAKDGFVWIKFFEVADDDH